MKKPLSQKNTLWTWKFIVLILINLTNGAAGQMTFPLVASFALDLGAELTVASSIAVSYTHLTLPTNSLV